jgi:hypothetical protein
MSCALANPEASDHVLSDDVSRGPSFSLITLSKLRDQARNECRASFGRSRVTPPSDERLMSKLPGSTADSHSSAAVVRVLQFAYRFITEGWLRARREPIPDKGFEETFRGALIRSMPEFSVSQNREMAFGGGYRTSSGILHEIDIVITRGDLRVIWELKHWAVQVDKNAVVALWAKILDYLAADPDLASQENVPVFVTTSTFDDHALAAALGLGIAPVAPLLRPPAMLDANLGLMEASLQESPSFEKHARELADDFRTSCRRLRAILDGTSLSARVGRLSESAITVAGRSFEDAVEAATLLRRANSLCTDVVALWNKTRTGAL